MSGRLYTQLGSSFIFAIVIKFCDSQACSLYGAGRTWIDGNGVVYKGISTMSYSIEVSSSLLVFTCLGVHKDKTSTAYYGTLAGSSLYLSTCFELSRVSTDKARLVFRTKRATIGGIALYAMAFKIGRSGSDICDSKASSPAYHRALLDSTVSTINAISTPEALIGQFNGTVRMTGQTPCDVQVSTDQKIVLVTVVSPCTYMQTQTIYPIHAFEAGSSSYIYFTDSLIKGANMFCAGYERQDEMLYVSVNPRICTYVQNATFSKSSSVLYFTLFAANGADGFSMSSIMLFVTAANLIPTTLGCDF